MLKEGKLYYSIKEVADEFKLPASTLRYWETQFSILKPKRTLGTNTDKAKKHRMYSAEDIEAIKTIDYLLNVRGYTIEGANDYLKRNRGRETAETSVIDTLTSIRKSLMDIMNEI